MLFAPPLQLHAQPTESRPSEHSIRPALVNTCIITDCLVAFYEPIVGETAKSRVTIMRNSRRMAAQSRFGNDFWPSTVPPSHGWHGFDVEDIEKSAATLNSDGILVGLTFTPSLRELKYEP